MNRSFKSMLCRFVLSGTLLAPSAIYAAQNHAPDNTAVNKRDRNTQQPTADQAKNNRSDRDLAKHIRRDVVHDKSLSTYGHNVKIIADHGKVTLRGPVHSEGEKRAIEEHARKYAGNGNVVNELTVKEEHDAHK
ncbi:MAG TPA: BON domain-containing protein [Bryobacteraceae bacterium]